MAFQSAIKQFSMIGNLAVGFSAGAYLLSQSVFVGASEPRAALPSRAAPRRVWGRRREDPPHSHGREVR